MRCYARPGWNYRLDKTCRALLRHVRLRVYHVEREVRLPDVSHYPATAYSEPMIRWRLLAAADVRRVLFSSPSVDRPMCAKQHHCQN